MGNQTINVLVTGAGRRVTIIKEFKKALNLEGSGGRVICVDMNPLSAGLYVADGHYIVPGADDPEYVPALLEICRQEGISVLVPTTDEELLVLSKEKGRFEASGTQVIVSSHETVCTCIDKLAAYRFLTAHNIPTPQTFSFSDLPSVEGLEFPLMVKPRTGKGSINCFKAHDVSELDHYVKIVPQPIVQRFVEGKEYTADVMCDRSGGVLIVVPRRRIATIAGVSQTGRTERNLYLEELAFNISTQLKIIGPANIQFIVDGGMPQCIEINPRLSGGIPLSLAAGADFARMILHMAQGKEVLPVFGRFEEGLIMLRYDEGIFIREGPYGYVSCDPL